MRRSQNGHLVAGRRLLAALVVLGSLAVAPAGADEDIRDVRQRREQAREAQAQAAAQLELLSAEDEAVARALADMQAAVDAQAAKVQRARDAWAAAEAEVVARRSAVIATEAEIGAARVELRAQAVEAFVGSYETEPELLLSGDLNRSVVRRSLIDVAAGSSSDALAELRVLLAERDEHVEAGQEAARQAEQHAADLDEALAVLEERRDAQLAIHSELRARIEAWEAEADAFAREAEELTQLIRNRQIAALGVTPGSAGARSVEGFVTPVDAVVGSRFGPRRHPIFGSVRMHTGVDMGAPSGAPIWAAKDGEVIFAGRKGGYGLAVIVQHAGNVATLYAHMSKIEASVGDWVPQGEIIGLVGSTGFSTGPHLHFEVRIDGVPKDPELFLPA